MPTGIHGTEVGYFQGDRPRLRELGFRVVVGEGAVATDVTDVASGLRYSSRLPGGFADCSFALHMKLAQAVGFLQHLAPVVVTFQGTVAWEGKIAEPPRGTVGAEALPVMALGRGAELKATKFTKLFVTSGYGRWKLSAELLEGERTPNNTQFYSPGFAPDTNVNPGLVVGYPVGQQMDANDRHAWLWVPPPGCDILRVAGSWNAIGSSVNIVGTLYALTSLSGYAGGSAETIVATRSIGAGDTTFDDTLATSGVDYLRLDFAQTVTAVAAADEFYHLHSMRIVGARTAEGAVFDPAQVTTWAAIRSLLAEYGGSAVQSSDEAMAITSLLPAYLPGSDLDASFAWDDLVFETPTTVEEAITRLNGPVGWEWGVFEDGLFYYGPLQTITTIGRSTGFEVNLRSTPPWWLSCLAQDGHRVVIAESLTDIVNEVRVYYTDASGVQQVYYASDFTNAANPLNERDGSGPRQRRTGTVDLPGTVTAAQAADVAGAYLAQYSRPQVKGEITWNGLAVPKHEWGQAARSQIDDGSTKEVMATPLIRPGFWVEVGDATGLVDTSWQTVRESASTDLVERGAPPNLLPIRSVEVNCDSGTVTCTVDSSRDVFGVSLARLAA